MVYFGSHGGVHELLEAIRRELYCGLNVFVFSHMVLSNLPVVRVRQVCHTGSWHRKAEQVHL